VGSTDSGPGRFFKADAKPQTGARPRIGAAPTKAEGEAFAAIAKKHSPDFYTWNPQLYFELLRGWPPDFTEEVRQRTIKFTYTDRAKGTSDLEWHLNNRDGYLSMPEYMALGIFMRVRLGYGGSKNIPAIWTPWKSFLINKASGGVGVRGKAGVAAIDEQDLTIVYYGRNRNARAQQKRAGKRGGDSWSTKPPPNANRTIRHHMGGAGASTTGKPGVVPRRFQAPPTKDITDLDLMMSSISADRHFNVQRMSDAVKIIAARHGFVGPWALVETTTDTLTSGVTIDTGLTDWAFLDKEARKYGFQFRVDHKGLHWHSIAYANAQKGVIKRNYTYGGPDVLKLHFLADYELPVGQQLKTTGMNPITREVVVSSAHSTTGVPILSDLPVEQQQNLMLSYKPAAVPQAGEMATPEAQARFIDHMLRKFKVTLTVVGDPAVLAGELVQLNGTGSKFFDRVWFVEEAKHDFEGSTYQTILTLRPQMRVKAGKSSVSDLGVLPPDMSSNKPSSNAVRANVEALNGIQKQLQSDAFSGVSAKKRPKR
jgi:phage protein D